MKHVVLLRTLSCLAVLLGCLAVAACSTVSAGSQAAGGSGERNETPRSLQLENLLSTELEGVAGTEVIVSRVAIPPHTTLPWHWHPGEEFGYILEGSVILRQRGKADVRAGEGEVAVVPLKQIHTAVTGNDGVLLLVFRVHEQGQPERILVE